MNGTPEGQKLWEQLKLRKDDKKFLSLDRLQTFLLSDIQHDVELRQILDNCGCGGIFEMLRNPLPLERCMSGYADGMRKFLGLGNDEA